MMEWLMRMEFDDFIDRFLQFEYENNMFEKKADGVCYWKYIRFNVQVDLCNYFGLYSKGLESRKKAKNFQYGALEKMRLSILKNPKLWKKRDILIIPHERKYEFEDGSARCIYTDALDRSLQRSHYILDKKSVDGYYRMQKSRNVIYMDIESQFDIAHKTNILFDKQAFERDVLIPIEQWFDIVVSVQDKNRWISQINARLNNRMVYQEYYEKVLDIICPKLIIMVVGYDFDRMILCEAAQKRNIPVVELQHGQVSRNHSAYNYLLPYDNLAFPDYFFCYGREEKETVRFPIAKEKVVPVGYPELERESNITVQKDDKIRIMFASQLNPEIAEYAARLANVLDSQKYEIIFKLHPKEYDDWHQRYGKIFMNSNIQIIGNYKETVHECLRKMDWVIGSSSTVLIEATMFDVKIIVLKVGLYEHVKRLYEDGYALLVDSSDLLASVIKNNAFEPKVEANVFFEKNSIEHMLFAIEEIIEKNEDTEE